MLRSFSAFLSKPNRSIQTDALFGLRDHRKRKGFITVWKGTRKQYKLCVSAHEEYKKFKCFVGMNWPEDFAIIERHLFKTAILSDELILNKANADALSSLLNVFICRRSQLYAQKVLLFHASQKVMSKDGNGDHEETLTIDPVAQTEEARGQDSKTRPSN